MKFNKENFLKTKFGADMVKCIDDWDLCLDTKDYSSARLYQKQWEVYQTAIKQFYGIEVHFTRTNEHYGIVVEDDKNWLYKVEKRLNKTPRASDEALGLISKMDFAKDY